MMKNVILMLLPLKSESEEINFFIQTKIFFTTSKLKKYQFIHCCVGLSQEKSPASQEVMMIFLSNNSFPVFSRRLTPQKWRTMIAIKGRQKTKLKLGNAVQKSHSSDDWRQIYPKGRSWVKFLVFWAPRCESPRRGHRTDASLTVDCWYLT